MPSDYHARFVAQAKKHLDVSTFEYIHHKAKSSAGGAARRIADDVPMEPGAMDAQCAPVNKSALDALKDMWATAVHAITGTDIVNKQSTVQQQSDTQSTEKEASNSGRPKNLLTITACQSLAKAINKSEDRSETDDDFAVHLGCGDRREPGAVGIDLVSHDDMTLPHDLALGVPLPDGVASQVFISKAAFDAPGVSPRALVAEAKRICRDGGQVLFDYSIPKTTDCADALKVIGSIDKHTPGNAETPLRERLQSVDEPRRRLVLKSLSGEQNAPIVGLNPDKKIMYGPALVPWERHFSGDVVTPEDIEYTAHGYMQKARVVGSEHSQAIDAAVVESFIAPCDLHFEDGPHGAQSIPKGSWVVGVKINDDEHWQRVLRGEYTGFSTGGFGVRGDWQDM